MKESRRAASPSASALVTMAALVLGAASLGSAAATRIASVARRVVTPAVRTADLRILRIDRAAQTITLERNEDTVLPGRYGLFTNGAGYLKLGAVLAFDEESVTRKLLSHVDAATRVGEYASFSGWYFDSPEQLHLPVSRPLIPLPVGDAPAWLFDAGRGDDWVIGVHGRGGTRAEILRAVPTLHQAGLTTLVMSYRDDGEAPPSPAGLYGLGSTEWQDVDAAIEFARERGARRVILMGWSMGGAIALQSALRSAHRDLIAGLILDSPVIDWQIVLDDQAAQLRIPRAIVRTAMAMLASRAVSRAAGLGQGIPFDELDMVARAEELAVPILLLHSDDDGFVPSDASHALAAARPDLVTMETFTVARHTKLWNYDEHRWTGAIRDWLEAQGLGR
ncbi:alpha/beta hydrolase family protein [Microbacterium paludicola]|uniref:alpha/beta hydrolase family protein n=1 Tax=Microbacterium paludicola TaxID=300019 RepID=UPI0031CE8E4B